MNYSVRQPHAVLDHPSRWKKARKIERLLDLERRPQPIKLLDIGTGSGWIAYYFASHPKIRCLVTALDTTDSRTICHGFDFVQVNGIELPFNDASFDVVLSNHVIEHVGDRAQQLAHLREMRRVLAPAGVGYLAVPNRWMLVEPHYRLAFLSWLPENLRTPYLRLMRRGLWYDCNPLSPSELDTLLEQAGFTGQHLEIEALHVLLDIEGSTGTVGKLISLLSTLPNWVLKPLSRLSPTLICLLQPKVISGQGKQ